MADKNGHDFRLPFPEATTVRCYECGAGEGSPRGKEPCKPVASWVAFRKEGVKRDD